MEIWTLWWKKIEFLLICNCVSTTVLMHHNTNRTHGGKARWELHKNATLNISCLKQHPTKQQLYGCSCPISQTSQVRRTRHVGHCCRRRNSNLHLMNSYVWMCQCWQSSKDLQMSVLCGHWMQSIEPARYDGWETDGKTESGNIVLLVQLDEYTQIKCERVCVCVCIYIYIYIYIHTHTHTKWNLGYWMTFKLNNSEFSQTFE